MNPEEGDLRPQLLDRFGLSVEVVGSSDPEVRVEIVRRRLAFDRDPAAFTARFGEEERALAATIVAAKERLASVRLPDRILLLIAGTCARLGVDGHRADIVTARTATALAALDGVDEVTGDHVKRAAKLALAHRRRRGPLQQPGLDDSELDQALNDSEPDDDPPPTGRRQRPRAERRARTRGRRDGPRARERAADDGVARIATGAPVRANAWTPRTRPARRRCSRSPATAGAPPAGARARPPASPSTPSPPRAPSPTSRSPRRCAPPAHPRRAARAVRAHPFRARGQPDRVLRGRVRVDGRAPPHGAGQGRGARAADRRLSAAGQGRARHVPGRRGGRPARADEQRRTRRRSAQDPAHRREDAARAGARADRADHPHRATPRPVAPRARDHRHRRPRRRPRRRAARDPVPVQGRRGRRRVRRRAGARPPRPRRAARAGRAERRNSLPLEHAA